ncbi:MAG TPA: organomercurial lyase [Ilumatobacter sp.]
MDQADIDLRNATYSMFVELGRAPTAADVGNRLRLDRADVVAGWRRLHDAHALVLNQHTDEIRMANPFSAVPTPFRVRAAAQQWYANCAWDAFGICAALDTDGRIDTACADCGEPLSCDVRGRAPSDPTLLFHCLVPAPRGGTTSSSPEAR